jgi:hypothetical protein
LGCARSGRPAPAAGERSDRARFWVIDVEHLSARAHRQLFETKSVPQENPRLGVPRTFLEAATDGFRDHVHNACAVLVFNLDEIEISEWEDRHEMQVIVPSAMRGQTIFHGVHRNLKQISVVTCISAAGEHMTPFFVCSQFNDAVERKLKLEGNRLGVDFILRRRSESYMSLQLFAEYISKALLPYIDELQSNEEFADQEAVLLMNNCSIHVQPETLQMIASHNFPSVHDSDLSKH